MGIMDDMKFDINVELYGADTANRKNAVQIEQERAKKADSQKHSVPRKFLKGVAAMPEKMLNAELMGREVSNANNREQAIESERKQKLIQKQKKQNGAKIDELESSSSTYGQGVNNEKQAIIEGESVFNEWFTDLSEGLSKGDFSQYGKWGLSTDFPSDTSEGNDFSKR